MATQPLTKHVHKVTPWIIQSLRRKALIGLVKCLDCEGHGVYEVGGFDYNQMCIMPQTMTCSTCCGEGFIPMAINSHNLRTNE